MDGSREAPGGQPAELAFIGDIGRPSEYCQYIEQPFISGEPTEEDVAALAKSAESCKYCALVLSNFYARSQGDGA